MKFFIDTANLDQIKDAQDLGVLDGVTTNPSLMAKEGITGEKNILLPSPGLTSFTNSMVWAWTLDNTNIIKADR